MDFFVMGMTLVGLLIGSMLIGVFAALRETNKWSASATAPRGRGGSPAARSFRGGG